MAKSDMEISRNSAGGNTLLPQAGHSTVMETPVLLLTFSHE